MKSGNRRFSILLVGLLFLLSGCFVACDLLVPASSSLIPPPQVQPSDATEGQPHKQLLPPEETASGDEWNTVDTFIGEGSDITKPFHISGAKWRINWAIDAKYPEYAVFDLFVYPESIRGTLTARISPSGDVTHDTNYIYEGGQDYYLKVVAANLRGWVITVEDYTVEAFLSPVQITRIYYKGQDTRESRKLYPMAEADEYVEIKNQSDLCQDIGGWVLKNATKGFPSFTFPALFPGSKHYCIPGFESTPGESDLECCTPDNRVHPGEIHPEYCSPLVYCVLNPHHSIRVYTGETHPESGGFCFQYYPGDIWNNETPDEAVLYDCGGREISRRSYVISTSSEVAAGK